MIRQTIIVGVLPVVAFAGVTGNWSNTSLESTAVSRLNWSTPGNWEGESVPQTVDDTASFTKYAMSDTSVARWIDLPGTMDLYKIGFGSASGPLRLIGGTLGLSYGAISSSGEMRLYADIKAVPASSVPGFAYVDVCGDFAPGMSIEPSSGYVRQRLDLYANAAGEVRENPMTTYVVKPSHGHLAMVAPQGADEIKAVWKLRNGSKLAVRSNTTTAHVLCAGTYVSSAGGELAAGTYLRRVFDDGTIELSEAAVFAGDEREIELTFAAFSPKVTQTIDQFNHFGIVDCLNLNFSKYRAEDSFRVTIGHLNRPSATTDERRESLRVTFGCETDYPATVIIRNTQELACNVVLDNCHLEFAMPPEAGYSAGFPKAAAVRQANAESKTTLTVTNNITAVIPALTNIVGQLVKTGAGMLVVGLPNAINGNGSYNNTGSLTVSNGTMRVVANQDESVPAVSSLLLSSDAILEIPADGFRSETFAFVPGATLRGGALHVTSPVNLLGLNLEDGATVVCEVNDGVVMNELLPNVASNLPAFWVDAQNENSFVKFEDGGTQYVTRWADTREIDIQNPIYMFATNAGNVHAKIMTKTGSDGSSLKYVKIDNHATTKAEEMEHLVWNIPLENIRAVFMVRDVGIGSGIALLGATARIQGHGNDFRRQSGWGENPEGQLFHSGCSTHVRNGRNYINGELTAWDKYYPYGYYYTAGAGGNTWVRPLVQEVHTTGNCGADCFGAMQPGYISYSNFNGYDSICECIVYTNVLSECERLSVEQYLMQKWVTASVSGDRFASSRVSVETLDLSGGVLYDVTASSRVNVSGVTGSGTFEKDGEGCVYVDHLQDGEADVIVRTGEMIVRSVSPEIDNLPSGAYIHLDASNDGSLSKKLKDDGVTYGIESWSDSRGAGIAATATTTNLPTLATVTINGRAKQVIDFGPRLSASSPLTTLGTATAMSFDNCRQLRSMAIVIGSRQGGGCLIGSTKSSWDGGLRRQNLGSSYTDYLFAYSAAEAPSPKFVNNGANQNDRPGGASWRINGEDVIAKSTGLSGGFDLVTLRTPDSFAANALSAYNYAFSCGGQEIAEVILWERMLSDDEMKQVETYLSAKWFGTARPSDYNGATVGSLTVAKAARLTVEGGSPIVVSSLTGAGTVQGGVAFAANGEIVFPVSDDGSTEPVTASSVRLPAALTVRLTGEKTRRLTAGRHVVLESVDIVAGSVCQLTLANPPQNRVCSLKVVDGAIVLDVEKLGMLIILR